MQMAPMRAFLSHYLSREWEYYPDALLTPEDDLDKYYFRYISIGEYGGMELGNSGRSPYGEWGIPVKNHASR